MKKEKEIKKRLSIEISLEKHKEIKIHASKLGISIKEFIEKLIYDYAKRLEKLDK